LRSPALISTSSKAGCYAVLASLSGRYPPLEGRSPTCYSPVCHSTNPLRGFRVRLACVRHAASVDSEPGSNSHVKWFSPARKQSKLANTKSRLLWPLRCSYLVCQVCRWFTAPRPAQTRTRSLQHAAPPADNSTGFCACTLYLVFKEPTPTEPDSRSRWPSPVFLDRR
jgi:hypothetical protein